MSQRLRFNTALDLFAAFPTAEEDISARPSDAPSMDFARMLLGSGTPEDAVTFIAYLLPRREAVWWGHQCLNLIPAVLEPQDVVFLDLAEDWVREPEEDQRVAALEAGMDTKSKSPAVWIALGAALSGGSMVAGELVIPPGPELTAKAINTGILSALARVGRNDRAPTLKTFVDMGLQLLGQEA